MSLTLDTNVFIELLRGRNRPVRDRYQAALAGEGPLKASLIVLHELLFGAEGHAHPATQRDNVRLLMAQVEVEPFDARDMAVTARLRSNLKRQGQPIGPFDALIAGQALARGWTVVTANRREFARIEGLKVVDWTAAGD